MRPSDRLLRQYLAEAMDPPRAEEIRDAVAASPELQARLAELIATTPPEPPSPQAESLPWMLPPPGARAPFLMQGSLADGLLMDGQDADWVELSIDVPEPDLGCVVVVLERGDDAWQIVFPAHDDEVVRAGELPVVGSARRLDVTLQPGSARLAVLLVPDPPDLSAADPWEAVRQAVASGQHPLITFDVHRR